MSLTKDIEFINLQKDMFLYRAKTENNQLLGNWFALSPDDARGYGNNIGVFKLKRDLKLINIQSLSFFNNFVDMLNLRIASPDLNDKNKQKARLLFPIGFFGYESQKKLFVEITGNQPARDISQIIEDTIQYFDNKSRISIYNTDKEFANSLKMLYGDISDGFISTMPWPSKIQNGMMLRELYINNNDDVQFEHMIDVPTSGGSCSSDVNTILPIYIPKEQIDAAFNRIYGTTDKDCNISIFKTQPLYEVPEKSISKNKKRTTRKNKIYKK